jgi:hypothetical protein
MEPGRDLRAGQALAGSGADQATAGTSEDAVDGGARG